MAAYLAGLANIGKLKVFVDSELEFKDALKVVLSEWLLDALAGICAALKEKAFKRFTRRQVQGRVVVTINNLNTDII